MLSILTLFLYFITFVFAKRVVQINMTTTHLKDGVSMGISEGSTKACWGEPFSKLQYLEIFSKIMIPIFLPLKISEDTIFLQTIIIFLVQVIVLALQVMMFHKAIAFEYQLKYIKLCFSAICVMINFSGITQYFLGIRDDHEGFTVVLPIIFVAICISFLVRKRSESLINRYITSI